jgi:putative transposase
MNRKAMINKGEEGLSIRRQCELLSISRSSYYYSPIGESLENIEIMNLMDKHILEVPTAGVLTMQSMLSDKGINASYERVRRLMRLADIYPIYPRKHLSLLGEKRFIYPYLLNGIKINRSNQVWETDITYIPMQSGFMYLTAIIDVYSRMIVGWGISNTLGKESVLEVIEQAIKEYGKPEILNSDQGSQFTCSEYVNYLKEQGIKISMDGKGRALDNIYIERFWRTIKYQYIYLNPAKDGFSLFKGIDKWIEYYNNRRSHQGIGRIKPAEKYYEAA